MVRLNFSYKSYKFKNGYGSLYPIVQKSNKGTEKGVKLIDKITHTSSAEPHVFRI